MKITAIVQGVWVATVFSTGLIATQGLVDQTSAPYQWGASESVDAGAQAQPDGESIGGDLSIARPNSESR
jgi:hypothetical protein